MFHDNEKSFPVGKAQNTNDENPIVGYVKIIKKVNKTMGQLSLFCAEEFYTFPKDLLEFREHFLTLD